MTLFKTITYVHVCSDYEFTYKGSLIKVHHSLIKAHHYCVDGISVCIQAKRVLFVDSKSPCYHCYVCTPLFGLSTNGGFTVDKLLN